MAGRPGRESRRWCSCSTPGALSAQSDVEKRLDAAATLFSKVMQTLDKVVPQELLDRSQCILIPASRRHEDRRHPALMN